MSSPVFRPVRATSPLVRDFVDGALDEQDRLVFRSAVLAHLAVLSGSWRVRQGENTWEQAGLEGSWSEIPKVVVDGVSWYSLDERWGWRSVLPLPSPRTETAGPIGVPSAKPTATRSSAAKKAESTADSGPPEPETVVAAVSGDDTSSTRSRVTRVHDRPLLRAVTDRTA